MGRTEVVSRSCVPCTASLEPGTRAPRARPSAARLLYAPQTLPRLPGAMAIRVEATTLVPVVPGKMRGEELGLRMEGSTGEPRDQSSREESLIWRRPCGHWWLLPGIGLPPRSAGPGAGACSCSPSPLQGRPGARAVTSRSHGRLGNQTRSLSPSLPLSTLPAAQKTQTGPVAPPTKAGLCGDHGGGFFSVFSFAIVISNDMYSCIPKLGSGLPLRPGKTARFPPAQAPGAP